MNKAIVHAVTLTVGMSLGVVVDRYLLNGATGNEPVVSDAGGESPPASSQVAATAAPATVDLAAMRSMIREELALSAKSAQAGRAAGKSATPAVAAAPSPQQQEQTMQALDVLINGGTWGGEQRAQFHQKLVELEPEQRDQVIQHLLQAINDGSLRVEINGPMF